MRIVNITGKRQAESSTSSKRVNILPLHKGLDQRLVFGQHSVDPRFYRVLIPGQPVPSFVWLIYPMGVPTLAA